MKTGVSESSSFNKTVWTHPALAATLVFIANAVSSSPAMNSDEGIFHYMGRLWAENRLAPYIGAIENKSPGIFMLTAISDSIFGVNIWFVRFLGLIAITATSLMLHAIGRRLINPAAGTVAALCFGFAMTWKVVNGDVAGMPETFMAMFGVLALYLLIKTKDQDNLKHASAFTFFAGVSLGAAITFKQIAVFTFAGLLIFSLVWFREKTSRIQPMIGAIALCTGTLTGVVAGIIPVLASGGSIENYIYSVWQLPLLMPKPPISASLDRFIQVFFESQMAAFYPGLLLFLFGRNWTRAHSIPYLGLTVWMAADMIGANASGFYYGHQIRQALPSFALLTGLAVGMICASKPEIKIWPVVFATAIIFAPIRGLGRAAQTILSGAKDPGCEFASMIQSLSSPNDKVFIYANAVNELQAYCRRVSPSPYFNTLFIEIPGVEDKMALDVTKAKPALILVDTRLNQPQWLTDLLTASYIDDGLHPYAKSAQDVTPIRLYIRND